MTAVKFVLWSNFVIVLAIIVLSKKLIWMYLVWWEYIQPSVQYNLTICISLIFEHWVRTHKLNLWASHYDYLCHTTVIVSCYICMPIWASHMLVYIGFYQEHQYIHKLWWFYLSKELDPWSWSSYSSESTLVLYTCEDLMQICPLHACLESNYKIWPSWFPCCIISHRIAAWKQGLGMGNEANVHYKLQWMLVW